MSKKTPNLFVAVDELDKCYTRFHSFQAEVELDKDEASKTAALGELVVTETKATPITKHKKPSALKKPPNTLGDDQNRVFRKSMLEDKGYEPLDFAYERSIGENDSVYSNFIELILQAKKKVGRIVVRDGIEIVGHATGFMVSEQLMLTNWHVFKSKHSVKNSTVEFNYELDLNANAKEPIVFDLDSDTFYKSNKELDYCLVALSPKDRLGGVDLSSIGFIPLELGSGKLGDIGKESLNIIHHPDGDYMQLSIRENTFTKVLSSFIWYESDTAQGSSGSPVFNDQWQLVALHHMGVAKKNKRGQYIDKDDEVIHIIDNKIDLSRIVWIANEGVRISVILKHLKKNYSDLQPIKQILENADKYSKINIVKQETIDTNLASINNQPGIVATNMTNLMKENINISIPQSIIEDEKQININLTTKSVLTSNIQSKEKQEPISSAGQITLSEHETLHRQNNFDYSDCTGYDPNFLGEQIEFPMPNDSIIEQMAISKDNEVLLDYHKFSVVFNATKKLPAISGINIDGDSEMRKDKTKRKDDWIKDRRIDLDVQLDQKSFYRGSGFDRGHMSRREDANWGENAAEAKRNADLTCVYTNACPQVPALNRSNLSGLWGKLEKVVLERGAEKEGGGTNKITVFSGPIFNHDDKIREGIAVPMEFYKIILWMTDQGDLKATGFKLSQISLVANIDFEQMDLDKDLEFQEYMCSISSLGEATNIDFSKLIKYDTYTNQNDSQLENENLLLEFLKSKNVTE